MLKVGITGGIGSGKTTACQIFEQMGIPVYNADQRAKALMTSDPELIAAIKRQFGNKAYLENGQLNRPFIATIVFSDKSQLQALNALVHSGRFGPAKPERAEPPDDSLRRRPPRHCRR
ncbi:MAG: dephospho-CoA kinase, partial [Bacteroidota bacterium]